jgi:transposase
MWTKDNRRYDRSRLRYESDLTDDGWAEIASLIPPAKPGGNKRSVNLRQVVNGLTYILSTGCQRRAIPKGFAARCMTISTAVSGTERCGASTTHSISNAGRKRHDRPVQRGRSLVRRASRARRRVVPTSIRMGGARRRALDSGDADKKVKGKKRHVLVDTQGLMLHAIVTAADIHDRDGGAWLLGTLFGLYPFRMKLYADGGYQGPEFRASANAVLSQVDVEIVKRSDRAKSFVVLPKRWVVQRTLAWLNRRRSSKDWENLNRKARAFLLMASICFMVRRLRRA